jgi:hypothetical protein
MLIRCAPTATTHTDQVIWHIEDALRATIGDRLVEKPEPISFPGKPTRRKIAAFSVIVARCGVPKERLRRLTVDDLHYPDQGTGRKVPGPITAELIIEDQPKRLSQIKGFLEALCGVNQKPASMRASPVPGFMHLALGAWTSRDCSAAWSRPSRPSRCAKLLLRMTSEPSGIPSRFAMPASMSGRNRCPCRDK